MKKVFDKRLRPGKRDYRHYNSQLAEFLEAIEWRGAASINNHVLDFESLRPYRISRFVRDPRDMIISGYHYHKRGAENWCTLPNPTEEDWEVVNGTIPDGLKEGESYSQMLQRLDFEDGLYAEMQFRSKHFRGMMDWPVDDPDILTFQYEELLGNEAKVYDAIFKHFGLNWLDRWIGRRTAIRHSAAKIKDKNAHIRDPKSGQWREQFSDVSIARFDEFFPGLVERLGYRVR